MKHTYPRAIQLVVSGQADVRSLVTHEYPLEKITQAFDIAKRHEGLKIIIKPNGK